MKSTFYSEIENIAFLANMQTIEREITWFNKVLQARMDIYFNNEGAPSSIFDYEPPNLSDSIYAAVVKHYRLEFRERIIVILSLLPHLRPQVLDVFFTKNAQYDRSFTEFGGVQGNQHKGFLPTGETAAFILAGNDLAERLIVRTLFTHEHVFYTHNILRLENQGKNEPLLSGQLQISDEFLQYFTQSAEYEPKYSESFPAKRLHTSLDWEDLILMPDTREDLDEILTWIDQGEQMRQDWNLQKLIKPGYRSLFYGPPGTGKTLSASLLGKSLGLAVYRIDLSMVVSKYIGETEKNLAGVFDQAEHKNWILFFDEADALFGKRSQTKDSKDRYANQETAYLLQRIEDFPGTVILATNLRANMDDAFSRRFQSMIYFPMPEPEQRYALWEQAFSGQLKLEPEVDLEKIAEKYEMAGGAIINVLRYCALAALRFNTDKVSESMIIKGIRREFRKDGKTV
ncbi:MAG: ATP-binding protein [Bernardetiaceae bacterium]|nr:ATP-binding protein [Bernardetiaceae bacterium]